MYQFNQSDHSSREQTPIRSTSPVTSTSLASREHIPVPSTSYVYPHLRTPDCENTPATVTSPKRTTGLLAEVNVTIESELTPKTKYLYKRATHLKRKAKALAKSRCILRKRFNETMRWSKSDMFEKVTSSMDRIKTRVFEMQLENVSKTSHGRRYITEDKVMAQALLKQCGYGYKTMGKIFSLPSMKTLSQFLNRIPIQPGICQGIFSILKAEASTFTNPLDKFCILLFDEMAIKASLKWNPVTGSIERFEDFGYKQTDKLADHVQVFMLRGIEKKWKQPIYYNFVEGATKTYDIVLIINIIVEECSKAGLFIIATVCDQGANNVAAIKYLLNKTKAEYIRRGLQYRDEFFEIAS